MFAICYIVLENFEVDQQIIYVLVSTHSVTKANIINMDETPCQFDMAGKVTFCTKGEKDVLINTSGHDHTR